MPAEQEMIAVNHFQLLNTELDTLGVSNKLVDKYVTAYITSNKVNTTAGINMILYFNCTPSEHVL